MEGVSEVPSLKVLGMQRAVPDGAFLLFFLIDGFPLGSLELFIILLGLHRSIWVPGLGWYTLDFLEQSRAVQTWPKGLSQP